MITKVKCKLTLTFHLVCCYLSVSGIYSISTFRVKSELLPLLSGIFGENLEYQERFATEFVFHV